MLADELRSHPLLREFTGEQVARLASRLDEVDIEPGTSLIGEGEPAFLFFVILEGTAQVVRGGRSVFTLGPGDFFGEVGLLDGAGVRTAEVVSTSPMRVAAMMPGDFRSMLVEMPDLGAVIRATAELRRDRPPAS